MNQKIYNLTLFFAFFPYLQLIPVDMYTQPYYAILGLIAFILLSKYFVKKFPGTHAFSLFAFAGFGLFGFVIAFVQSGGLEEIKGAMQYMVPLTLAPLSYFLTVNGIEKYRKLTVIAIGVWLGVGAIQTFVDPAFATELTGRWGVAAAYVVVESGRGVLSLAPEPTHFALHVFGLLALAMVLGERKIRVATGLALLVVFSLSSTLVLIIVCAILLSIFLANILNTGEQMLIALIALVSIGGLFLVDQNSRLYQLGSIIVSNPMSIFALDGSVNARASGLVLGTQAILNNWFLPYGLANSDWLLIKKELIENSQIFHSLSSSGVASGYLRPVYEIGFFAVPFLILFVKTILAFPRDYFERVIMVGFIGMFFMQFLISSPLFGLVYGAVLARTRTKDRT